MKNVYFTCILLFFSTQIFSQGLVITNVNNNGGLRVIESNIPTSISDVSGNMTKTVIIYTGHEKGINLGDLQKEAYAIRRIDEEGNIQVAKYIKL